MALIPCNIIQQGNIYTIDIFGQSILVTVTKYPAVVKDWIDRINANGNTIHRHVGFAMEYDFNIHRIGTVQFCIGNWCLVFQLVDTRACPPSLKQFLGDNDKFSFVGILMEGALQLLDKQLPLGGSIQVRFIDLAEVDTVARDDKFNTLASVATGVVEGDWGRPSNLSDEQVKYACLDAFLNLHCMPTGFR